MYKKRLRAWGYTKQVKSNEKEKALLKILRNEPVTDDIAAIRHDKLIRYARSRIKSGALDSNQISKLTNRFPVLPVVRLTAAEATPVPLSPAPPDQFTQFDTFLRSMQLIIARERVEYVVGYEIAPDAIFRTLAEGMTLWRQNSFTAARISFGRAANRTIADLRQPQVSVSRIAFCISSILWGSERSPVFQKFSDFMVNAALEILGPECPLTMVLRHIRTEQSIDAQIRIWECALDNYEIREDNLEHWWSMVQRRWQWCWRCDRLDLAADFCRQAVKEARQNDKLSVEMEEDAQQDLDMIALHAQTYTPQERRQKYLDLQGQSPRTWRKELGS
jgi:hypothetical protein